jgi:hypothetical protein
MNSAAVGCDDQVVRVYSFQVVPGRVKIAIGKYNGSQNAPDMFF